MGSPIVTLYLFTCVCLRFETPGGTCRDFRLKENPDIEVVRENAAATGTSDNKQGENIRIHHQWEVGIRKSITRITVWLYEACRVMTNGDPEGWIFLSHPHSNSGLFFMLTIKYGINTV